MRTVLVLVLALLAGCGDSPREHDCKRVYEILRSGPEHTKLRAMTFKDPEVSAAVTAMLDETGWTSYTPYSTERPKTSGADRLAALCGR